MSVHPALPETLPLFPIRGCILLPGEALPLNVFEPRYLNMIDDAMAGNGFIGMIQPRPSGPGDRPDLERVGTAGRIAKHSETGDGRYLIVVAGLCRFNLAGEAALKTPYRVGRTDFSPFAADLSGPEPDGEDAGRVYFLSLLKRFFAHTGIEADWDSVSGAPLSAITNKVAMAAPFDAAAKQALLQANRSAVRLQLLISLMEAVLEPGLPGTDASRTGRLH